MSEKIFIIPPVRVRYLAEIREECRRYDQFTEEESDNARKLFQLFGFIEDLKSSGPDTHILKSEYSRI
ncbi:hypothetical protein ISU91_19595 [Leptospira borgpetersenii serovar Hardjo-bovis]|nr:hypothetical protein [Leptospira borgpetersenii serovar Hardjo-bovis]